MGFSDYGDIRTFPDFVFVFICLRISFFYDRDENLSERAYQVEFKIKCVSLDTVEKISS